MEMITTSTVNRAPGTSLMRIARGMAIAPNSTLLYIFYYSSMFHLNKKKKKKGIKQQNKTKQ
jgi:hypothetical protein